MQRTNGRILLVVGMLAMAACSPGEDVSENTAVPTGSTEPSASISDELSDSEPTEEPATLPATTDEPSDITFALPGLVDPSDEPITNDDEVRGNRQGPRTRPPADYAEQFEAFTKGRALAEPPKKP